MVFAGLFPTDADEYANLRDAMEKLRLNDASFSFEPENSTALGFGFRCGFLGPAPHGDHPGAPGARVRPRPDHDGARRELPGHDDAGRGPRDRQPEPPARRPTTSSGSRSPTSRPRSSRATTSWAGCSSSARSARGIQKSLEYLAANRVVLTYDFPLNEVVLDFYDKLKSISKGYASFDYEFQGYREGDLVKLDLLVNGEPVDALSLIVHREAVRAQGTLPGREDERNHPPADVRGGDPGGDRLQDHRPGDRSRRSGRTFSPSATAATSRGSGSCSRSRRKARSA